MIQISSREDILCKDSKPRDFPDSNFQFSSKIPFQLQVKFSQLNSPNERPNNIWSFSKGLLAGFCNQRYKGEIEQSRHHGSRSRLHSKLGC